MQSFLHTSRLPAYFPAAVPEKQKDVPVPGHFCLWSGVGVTIVVVGSFYFPASGSRASGTFLYTRQNTSCASSTDSSIALIVGST